MAVEANQKLRFAVFALVAAAFSNIYLTQPIGPALELVFATDTQTVAWTVSAVLLGIACGNIPLGALSDRVPIRPIVIGGASLIAGAGLVCAATESLEVLIAARFVQGLGIPALTTSLAAYVSKTQPVSSLNRIMGAYVLATLLGGMFGRLLGGFVHPPEQWRQAFISGAVIIAVTLLIGLRYLPNVAATTSASHREVRYGALMRRPELVLIYVCAAAGQGIFSPIFNTVPYRLAEAPMNLSPRIGSLIYLTYLIGLLATPWASTLSDKHGHGRTLITGSVVLIISLLVALIPSVLSTAVALLGVCAGFFALHSAAVAALNHKLSAGQGRANALYVMWYYIGAGLGVSWSAAVYQHFNWTSLIGVTLAIALIPLSVGVIEQRHSGTRLKRA